MHRSHIVLAFLFIIALFSFSNPSAIYAKDYLIKSADINVDINTDGSAGVTETRVYQFDGQFSWADMWIPLTSKCSGCSAYTISKVSLSDENDVYLQNQSAQPGTYLVSLDSDNFYIKWYYSALDEEKRFVLRYTVDNAVTRHRDIAEFYWQLIGDEWSKPTYNINAVVTLPSQAPPEGLYAFGHGPLNGIVTIPTRSNATFQADILEPNTFFEIRFLFPKEIVNGGQNSTSDVATILAEEAKFAAETKRNAYMLKMLVAAALFIPIVLTFIILVRTAYWAYKWFTLGNDSKLAPYNLSGKLHEPPSRLHPALVECFVKWTQVPTSKSIVATIIELARKKAIQIDIQKAKALFGHKDKYSLRYTPASMKEQLTELEHKLIDFLFHSEEIITFDAVASYNRKYPERTRTFWKEWEKEIQLLLVEEGLMTKESVVAHKRLSKEMGIYIVLGAISIFL